MSGLFGFLSYTDKNETIDNDEIVIYNNNNNNNNSDNESEYSDNESEYSDNESIDSLQSEEEEDCLDNYFVDDKINIHGGFITNILWTGFNDDNLSLSFFNRKINIEHAIKIRDEMKNDYKRNGHFNFYDLIQLAKIDNKYYVIDGQHRFVAYKNLIKKNKYNVQKIPCMIKFCKDEEEGYELICNINNRLVIKKEDFIKYKMHDIVEGIEKMFDKIQVWGTNRPKINKNKFIEKIKNNDNIENMKLDEIIAQINKINNNVRAIKRNKRSKANISKKLHDYADENNFYLFYDNNLNWIDNIK